VSSLMIVMLVLLSLTSRVAFAEDVVLPLPEKDQQEIAAHLGSGVVGKALPSKTIDDISTYFPLKERTMSYQVTSGPHAGKTQTLELAKLRRPGGNPAWRFQVSPTLGVFVRQTPQGDLITPAITDKSEGVVVVTTPANLFLLKGMKPGESRSFTQKVSVDHLDDPTDQQYSGTLKGTFTYVGTYQVTVPAGTFEAILLRSRCEGKVGPAQTHDTAYYFFAAGVGVVAMIVQEDATALWIFHIDSTTGKVLSSK